jgi:hypothetical protein
MAERKPVPGAEEARAADLADQAQDVEENHRDETVPGGKYEVGGRMVDANGQPLKGKKSDDE